MTKIKSITPLNLSSFTTFFLIPYIACRLIQQDLGCTVQEAYNTMIESGDAGAILNPDDDDDEELDMIQYRSMRLAKTERERKEAGHTVQPDPNHAHNSNGRPRPVPAYKQCRLSVEKELQTVKPAAEQSISPLRQESLDSQAQADSQLPLKTARKIRAMKVRTQPSL